GLKFRPEQPSQWTRACCNKPRVYAVIEGCCEVAGKVVRHFRFQLNVGVDIETDAPSNSHKVYGRISRAEPKVFRERSDFYMIFGRGRHLCRHPRWSRKAKSQDNE